MAVTRPSFLTAFFLLTNAVLLVSAKKPSFFPVVEGFVGGVYVMSNDLEANSVIAYGRRSNGTMERIGSFATGGKGAALDELDGVDPLISSFAVIPTPDNRFLIAVNAGSSSISVFQILQNFRLRLRSIRRVAGSGPSSVAFSQGIVYVASASSSNSIPPDFELFALKGALTGFRLTKTGRLRKIKNSVRRLSNRPSAIQFTPDGSSLVVSSTAAGSTQLDTTEVDEISVFRVLSGGLLSAKPIDTATSTLPNNAEGRNLPGAIGLHTVRFKGKQYVTVPEARIMSSDGASIDPQVSSVSTWRITSKQKLIPTQIDLPVGRSLKMGQIASCWIEFSRTSDYFWVANAGSGSVSAFSFKKGKASLVEEVAGTAAIPIDLWLSSDGKFLYVLSNGAVDVFEVANNGFGAGLTAIQTVVDGIPETNVQGIVAI